MCLWTDPFRTNINLVVERSTYVCLFCWKCIRNLMEEINAIEINSWVVWNECAFVDRLRAQFVSQYLVDFEEKEKLNEKIQSVKCIWQPMNFYDAESCLLFIYCFINELASTETIAIAPIMINTEARKAKRTNIYSIYIQVSVNSAYKKESMDRFGLFHMRFKDINVIYLYITILIACINGYIWITGSCVLIFYFRFWNFVVALQLIESQC